VLGLHVQGKGFLVGLVKRGGLQGRLLLGLGGFGSSQQAIAGGVGSAGRACCEAGGCRLDAAGVCPAGGG
jgi:hypothetical protein